MKYTILISRLNTLFYKETGFIILLLLLCGQGIGQTSNPSASALISFEQYPTDFSTGMPYIALPLYSMPTRSKDITVDMSLNYHPSSVAAFNYEMGDCGQGWSLNKGGGVIFRTMEDTPDEINWLNNTTVLPDVYEFQFMGYSGKFIIEKKPNNELEVFMTENKGIPIHIDIDYDVVTYKINSFTVYDDKGYGYEFSVFDEVVQPEAVPVVKYRSVHHLSKIHDSNNIVLVNFDYNTYNRILPYHGSGDKNVFHIMSGIHVLGFGEVELELLYADNTYFNYVYYESVTMQYESMVIKDYLENQIRKFDFIYTTQNDRIILSQLDEINGSITQTHHFEYKSIPSEITNIKSVDRWGYFNFTNKWCYNDALGNLTDIAKLSSNFSTNGILQKILFPSGGSVIYEYERNTYHYTNSRALDQAYNLDTQTWETVNDFFYDLDPNRKANNLHNYNVTTYATKSFSSSFQGVLSFSVSGTKTFHFKFDAEPQIVVNPIILDPEGNPLISYNYPVFALKKDGTLIRQFSISNGSMNIGYENQLNNGLGKELELTSGNYTIEMTLSNVTNGSATVNEVSPVAQVKKWWYGGGVRIKKIGYFNEDVNRRYYQGNYTTPLPIREISYDYNLFDEPNKSSGYLKNVEYSPYLDYSNYDIIRYKNITVYDSSNNGKTQYECNFPMDNPSTAEYVFDQKIGKITDTKIFNGLNELLYHKKCNYDYDASIPARYLFSNVLIWNMPKKIIEKMYKSEEEFETTTSYEYNTDIKIQKILQHTSRENDTISTRFYYSKNNSLYSKNRNVIERTERYKNSDLLTTSSVIYSKTWPQVAEDFLDTNVSYLPVKTENSKENYDANISGKVTLYDVYSNVIEFENETGVKTVNIWGYNKTLLVAKLENIAYSQVPQNLITAIHTASNSGNESSLLSALNNLRNDTALSGAMITTYTYKPLVGVSTITDVQKRRVTYEYDDFGRQELVKDHDGNVLSKNEYHLKTQN